jgi:hypothetical protein
LNNTCMNSKGCNASVRLMVSNHCLIVYHANSGRSGL